MRGNNEENALRAGAFDECRDNEKTCFRVFGHKLEVFICQITEEIRNPLTIVSYLLIKVAPRTGMLLNYKLPTSPQEDQSQAIAELVKGFKDGNQFRTLLGVTGSGKTFEMTNIIRKLQKQMLVIAYNKTLASQLYGEFKEMFPENAVEYFVLFGVGCTVFCG